MDTRSSSQGMIKICFSNLHNRYYYVNLLRVKAYLLTWISSLEYHCGLGLRRLILIIANNGDALLFIYYINFMFSEEKISIHEKQTFFFILLALSI